MTNVIEIKSSGVNKIYLATSAELLSLAYPRRNYVDHDGTIHFETLETWFKRIAKSLSRPFRVISWRKIKHIYYGTSQFTDLERNPLEDAAILRAQSQPDIRQLNLLEGRR